MPALLAPPIHVRSAPSLDPPYDDEIGAAAVPPVPAPAAQPPLPLDWSGPRRFPPGRATQADIQADVAARPVAARRPHSPAQGATMHFLSLCLEVLNGYRPATHLRPLSVPAEFDGIAAQIAAALERAVSPSRRAVSALAVSAPPRPGRPTRPIQAGPVQARPVPTRPVFRPAQHGPAARIRLRELRVCEPRPGVAEVAAVLGHNDRAFALALRLERRPAGWLCTLAQVI